VLDLRNLSISPERKKAREASKLRESLTDEQKSVKDLAEGLEEKANSDIAEIRSRDKTSNTSNLSRQDGAMFNFLLEETYHFDFLELLKLNQTKADKNNTKSKLTLLSQKNFLGMIKKFKPEDERVQKATQSTFYKWLCRNGLGTETQITKYYVSRSKEIANKVKRRVIIEELVDDLGERPELIKKLFTYPEFREEILNLIKEGI
jgi:hypothetical protein